jgi:uncharacterized protein YchJ
MGELIASAGPVATEDAYASVLKVKVPPQISKLLVHIKENDTDDVDWKILASCDDVTYFEELAEEEVLQDGSSFHEVSKAWLYLDIQVKSAVAEAPGSVSVSISGVGGA